MLWERKGGQVGVIRMRDEGGGFGVEFFEVLKEGDCKVVWRWERLEEEEMDRGVQFFFYMF